MIHALYILCIACLIAVILWQRHELRYQDELIEQLENDMRSVINSAMRIWRMRNGLRPMPVIDHTAPTYTRADLDALVPDAHHAPHKPYANG